MADKSKTVIVKKVKKGHEGAHGGSWKVAYADFVTAMMAFFLLMWLLAMVSPEKKAAVSEYFKHFSLFQESGKSFMKESSEILTNPDKDVKNLSKEFGQAGEMSAEQFKNKLKKAIDEKMQALKEHLMVDTVEGGVRIQLVDTEGKPMFRPGSAEPSPSAIEILRFVADNIREMTNKIAVEGHTDSSPLNKEKFTNWELSTERASAARRLLQEDGIDSGKIARVVGYADTELLYKDKPTDSRNRRISIILLQEKAQETGIPKLEPAERAETKPVEAPPPLQKASTPTITPAATSAPAPKAAPGPAARQEQNRSLIAPIAPRNPVGLINKPIGP